MSGTQIVSEKKYTPKTSLGSDVFIKVALTYDYGLGLNMANSELQKWTLCEQLFTNCPLYEVHECIKYQIATAIEIVFYSNKTAVWNSLSKILNYF